MIMNNASDILSFTYKNQIDEACKYLPNLGLKNFVMYLIYNDGSTLILSNVYSIIEPYYQEALCEEDYTYTPEMIQPFHQGYYLCEEQSSMSENLKELFGKKYHLHPIFNIIRKHPECTFVFSAINDSPINFAQKFYEKTVKKFEDFCIRFLDALAGYIVKASPEHRYSFALTNKPLRDAIIRQGYEKDILLSMREKECLWFIGLGKTIKEISQELQISHHTVEGHLKSIREKFNCNKLPEIVMECIHRGIIGKVSPFKKNQSPMPGKFLQVPRKTAQVA